MLEIIISIGALFVLAIIYLIFRITVLAGVAKDSSGKPSRGASNGIFFVVFLILGGGLTYWYSVYEFDNYTLPIASEHGIEIDRIFWITMAVTGIIFVITHILLFIFPYRYKYSEKRRALFYPDNNKLELLWTVVPAMALAVLVFSGWKVWTDVTTKAPEEAEVVEIFGYQFAWKARYPGRDGQLGDYDYRLIDVENELGMDFSDRNAIDDFVEGREVHIPKGQPVLFKIRARDVLHSVFMPEFRLKMDAVPGMPTNFWFTPSKTTEDMRAELDDPDFNYFIYCTEVCGRGHFSMRIRVVVDEPEDYEKWYAEQKPWLSKNPEYLAKVPSNMKELASLAAGVEDK